MPPADNRPIVETTIRVRFAETDMMGVVHHASYLAYLEEGRSEYTRQCGAPYAELQEMGYFLAVGEMTIRYHASATYDDLITVRTWLDDLRSRGVTFGYEVLDSANGRLLITASVRLICIDQDGQARCIPSEWVSRLAAT
jgi:acyl-CoA thioester hydrolase